MVQPKLCRVPPNDSDTCFLQVLTHVKEKLQYIEKENEALQVSPYVWPVCADLSVLPLPGT